MQINNNISDHSDDGAPIGREPAVMSVRNAAVWAMVGQYLSFGIQFVSSVIISRFFLSASEVGLFSIALAAALVVAVIQDFGLTRYIGGLPSVSPQVLERCATVSLVFSVIVSGSIGALAWPVAHLYHEPRLVPMMLIIAANYLFVPLSIVPTALLTRAMNFRGLFIINVSSALVQACVALGLAAAGYSVFALAWATLAGGMARGLISQGLRPALPWRLRVDNLRPILAAGTSLSGLNICYGLTARTPDMVVGKLLGLTSVGLYSRATSLSDQFRTLIAGAIGGVFFPAFARIRDRGESIGPAYLRVVAGYTVIIWPGMAGLGLSAFPVVRLLYGSKWTDVAPLLSMISFAEILLFALPLSTELGVVMGRVKQLFVLYAVEMLVSFLLLVAGSHWGTLGAAASRIVYSLAWIALYSRFMYGLIQFDVTALLKIYAKSAAATLAGIMPLSLTYLLWMGPTSIDFVTFLGAVVCGATLWLASIVLVGHPAVDDLLGIAGHLPGGSAFARIVRSIASGPKAKDLGSLGLPTAAVASSMTSSATDGRTR